MRREARGEGEAQLRQAGLRGLASGVEGVDCASAAAERASEDVVAEGAAVESGPVDARAAGLLALRLRFRQRVLRWR